MTMLELVKRNSSVLFQIYTHPFNHQLRKGTLSPAVFRHYVIQDSLYLRDFAQAFYKAAVRFPSVKEFKELGEYIEKCEQKFHIKYLNYPPNIAFFNPNKKILSISKYTTFLHQTATKAPIEVAAAAFRPCFNIYEELGKQMKDISPDNPFFPWMKSYRSDNFLQACQKISNLSENLNREIKSSKQREAVDQAFFTAATSELGFLDEIYPHHLILAPTPPEPRFA